MSSSYKAFISYSHEDTRWANWLHRKLEGYRIPKHLVGQQRPCGKVPDSLAPIFRDREDLASAHDLSSRIVEALGMSDNLVVICSPEAAQSRWVNEEIACFKRLGRSARVFCFVVDGEPGAGGEQECFPPALLDVYDEHGLKQSGRSEPLAADARKGADGRSLALTKLIAGLLDLNLDALRRRELQRKQRQLATVLAASVCLVTLTTTLAINAIVARNEANQRQQQAESLLAFMVGDLRAKLQPIGKLELLESVGERAMAYFATVDVDDLSSEEKLRQVQVLTQLGEISFEQLQHDRALQSFRQAYERSAALYHDNPDDGERLYERAQAEFWLGYSHWRKGDLEPARRWLEEYLGSALALVELDPGREDWRREAASGYHNLAVLDLEAGNLEEAAAGFRLELAVIDELAAGRPASDFGEARSDIASWLGEIALKRGELSEALAHFADSVRLIKAFSTLAGEDARYKSQLGGAIMEMAGVAAQTGQIDQAEALTDKSREIFRQLTLLDAENTDWQRQYAWSNILGARIMAAQGEWPEAAMIASSAIDSLNSMLTQGVEDRNIHVALVEAYLVQSWIGESRDDLEAALNSSAAAVAHAQIELSLATANEEAQGRAALSKITHGTLLLANSRAAEADAAYDQARTLLAPAAARSASTDVLDPWLRLLIVSDEGERARLLREDLRARGYRPLRPWPG